MFDDEEEKESRDPSKDDKQQEIYAASETGKKKMASCIRERFS